MKLPDLRNMELLEKKLQDEAARPKKISLRRSVIANGTESCLWISFYFDVCVHGVKISG